MFTFFLPLLSQFCCCFDIYLATVFFFWCFVEAGFYFNVFWRVIEVVSQELWIGRVSESTYKSQLCKTERQHLSDRPISKNGCLSLVTSLLRPVSWHCGRAIATNLLLYNFAWNCWPGWWNFNLYINMSGENCQAARSGSVHWPCVYTFRSCTITN